MSFNFNFTTLGDMCQLKELIDFMASQNLRYPHYEDWIQRTESQLGREEKEAILAFSDGRLVANLVHQTCRDSGLGFLREIKNARVHPELRDRYFMRFMFRQLYKECEGKFDGIIVDVRADQTDTLAYFKKEGFVQVARTNLYERGMEEITFFRLLVQEAKGLVPIVKRVILEKSI